MKLFFGMIFAICLFPGVSALALSQGEAQTCFTYLGLDMQKITNAEFYAKLGLNFEVAKNIMKRKDAAAAQRFAKALENGVTDAIGNIGRKAKTCEEFKSNASMLMESVNSALVDYEKGLSRLAELGDLLAFTAKSRF